MKFIFIDGYNVINSWSNLKSEKEISLDSARQKLIDILHNYRVAGNLENKYEYNKNLTVVFTKSGETADAYIEREIHNIGRRFEVSVVTSDSLEQQTIFQRGATRISSIEFYNMVFDTSEDIRRATKKVYTSHKSTVQDNIDDDVLKKLEAMRRG